MKNDYFMKQCILKKENTYTTSWIPEELAKVGEPVAIRENGEWIGGYEVTSVSTTRQLASLMIKNEMEYEKHRGKSDI